MSTHPVTSASVDLQLGSGLILAPIEIRRAIYVHLIPNGVHVFFRQGKIHLSVCVEPSPAGDHDGSDRGTTSSDRQTLDDWFLDNMWARRLRSLRTARCGRSAAASAVASWAACARDSASALDRTPP